jgi:hypothetical protein
MSEERWGDPSIDRAVWRGQVRMIERVTAASLDELVGIDTDAWQIVGVQISGGEAHPVLRVLALERSAVSDRGTGSALERAAAAHGGAVPVTEFEVHNADPYAVLQAITHKIDLRLRHRNLGDLDVVITDRGDLDAEG